MTVCRGVLVFSEENSSATIVEHNSATKEGQYFTNVVVEIVLWTERGSNTIACSGKPIALSVATTAPIWDGAVATTQPRLLGRTTFATRHKCDHGPEGAECWSTAYICKHRPACGHALND